MGTEGSVKSAGQRETSAVTLRWTATARPVGSSSPAGFTLPSIHYLQVAGMAAICATGVMIIFTFYFLIL
jgi:hypothetical protein